MARAPKAGPFSLGRVVVPARDGMLRDLGHDVATLGARALGFVVEARGARALVDFPELKLRLWLATDELADVQQESESGRGDFAALVPNFEEKRPEEIALVWWMWHFFRRLPATHLLGLETGPLAEVWDYYSGDTSRPVAYVGIGVSELVLEDWESLRRELGSRVLFARFLPAGLSKMEIALYLTL
jgi:hypothetical protein